MGLYQIVCSFIRTIDSQIQNQAAELWLFVFACMSVGLRVMAGCILTDTGKKIWIPESDL